MKEETLKSIIEGIAKSHLGINCISDADNYNLSSLSIKVALSEALKAGEKIGYSEGFHNAKESCDCEDTLNNL